MSYLCKYLIINEFLNWFKKIEKNLMIKSLLIIFIVFILVIIIIILAIIVKYNRYEDREKSSSFECGFDPKNSARVSFSLRFFLLAVIFLIFDIEIIFFFPIPYIILSGFSLVIIYIRFVIFWILLIGLFHEWREGSLDWSK